MKISKLCLIYSRAWSSTIFGAKSSLKKKEKKDKNLGNCSVERANSKDSSENREGFTVGQGREREKERENAHVKERKQGWSRREIPVQRKTLIRQIMHFVWSEMAREKGGKLGHSEKNKSGEVLQNNILTLFFLEHWSLCLKKPTS